MALTGWSQLLFANTSTASEASLLAGVNLQPAIPALYFDTAKGVGRTFRITADGIFSNTGTPTMTFQARMGTTSGSATLSGASIGVSAAITTTSGVTNVFWRWVMEFTLRTPGTGTGNATIAGSGLIISPAGFASPFAYPTEPTTPNTATWTQTFDGSLTQYLNLSLTWSASSASNTCQLKKLLMESLD
jgi:hypothetical protein